MIITDAILEQKIKDFEAEVQQWAEKRQLWTDSHFTSYLERYDDEPSEHAACVTVLLSDGGIWRMVNGYIAGDFLEEFQEFLDSKDFYYELHNSSTLHFYCVDEGLNEDYLKYFEWKWITNLIKPNYTTLYDEIFEHFRNDPTKLYNLEHRKFEVLISEIFRNQGFRTELGKGVGDGGIDVKLFKKDEIDEIVNLVQVKRYKPTLPIKLEAVSSLSAIVNQENANRGLFVTTSRYLPVAKEFAARENTKLTLADSSHVQLWCEFAKNAILRDKSQLVSDSYLKKLIDGLESGLQGKIVYCTNYSGMITTEFCMILKDSDMVVLLLKIPDKIREYTDGPYNSSGKEIPAISHELIKAKIKDNVFRAQKNHYEDGMIGFSGRKKLYFLWDGAPKTFDLMD